MPANVIRIISFGHCDPAGVAVHPNAFCGMDAAFDDLLRALLGDDHG